MTFLFAAIVGLALLVLLVALEERGRPEVVVLAVVLVTLLDAVLFPQQEAVPIGPFRPALGGQDLRPADVLILVGVAARLLVRGLPRRVTAEGLAWTAFMAWYAYAGLVGVVRDQPSDLLLYQLKLLVETGGMMALVAGVPLTRLSGPRLIDRVGIIGGAIAALVVALAAAGLSIALPGGAQVGTMSPDAATILFTVGVIVSVTAACREQLPVTVLVGGAVMMAAPFVADQRAALVGVVPAVAVLARAMRGRHWRRRSALRPATLVPVVAVLLVPFAVVALQSAASGEGVSGLPLVARISETFGSEQKRASSDVRLGLLREGERLARERPVIGQGLGQPVLLFDGRSERPVAIGDFHNIAVDAAVRTGVPGLLLLALALTVTALAAARRWAGLARSAHAGLVLAAGAALSGLVLKGMFETIFQKYRLAVVLGLLLGLIAAAAESSRSRQRLPVLAPEPQWT